MNEIVNNLFTMIDFVASVLGFFALYAIAIALLDWRKMKKIENEWKQLKDD